MSETNNDSLPVPAVLPVIPVRDVVVFPFMLAPLVVNRPRSAAAVDAALAGDRIVGLFLQKNKEQDDPGQEDLSSTGTAAVILKMMKAPDGSIHLLAQGIARITVEAWVDDPATFHASVATHYDPAIKDIESKAQTNYLLGLYQKIVALSESLPDEWYMTAMNIEEPGKLADFIASTAGLEVGDRQEVLATFEVLQRMKNVASLAQHQLEVLELTGKIEAETRKGMDKAQREYILRQQMREIQKELGEEDPQSAEMNELRQKIEEAGMPEAARTAADRELDRLSKMPPAAAEYTVSRTYLDWLVTMPWSKSTEDNLDIHAAREILNADHYDLEEVKDRILEYLSVRKLKADMKGPILCFVGPPGVGKTSLGQSIARALGRKFVRISLGGVRDEAEIRGHRRTYIGSLPGRILQGLRNADSNNPLFMLDEIDKLGSDFRGDPSAALLEVLDPAQNHSFSDHYLDVPVDLSKVMFITTGNILDTIPPALLDRMETLRLPGYTTAERLAIACQYLIPRQLEAHGLTPDSLFLSQGALRRIIVEYTREAGVRNLEREIGSVCRKAARKIAESLPAPVPPESGEEPTDEQTTPDAKTTEISTLDPETLRKLRSSVNSHNLPEYLGAPRFFSEVAEMQDRVGVSTGLAWTQAGGDILFIETAKMKGRKGLILTGQLGDVMQESAQTALSYLRAHAKDINIPETVFEKHDIHVHVPAGAIPKDGPSAGVAICTALASLLSNKPARHDVAMTGEITLTGRVLPIGGVKEKVLAARQAGIHTVILPEKNRKDADEIPEELRRDLQFIFAKDIKEVLQVALNGVPSEE
ncbi:MAG: endopeptidase La [Armatimonadetes bacterium]|nr:endopeptidase La [Armatimonadota bacterium]